MNCEIKHIIISPGHNFVGHTSSHPGENPAIEKSKVTLIQGKGIDGDRYALKETGHRQQITFFDVRTLDALSKAFNRLIKPEEVRRNIFVSGIDLPELVGKKFSIQGIEFIGVDPCPPCQWMEKSVGEGARELMEGRAGLRAKILTVGTLSTGPADFVRMEEACDR